MEKDDVIINDDYMYLRFYVNGAGDKISGGIDYCLNLSTQHFSYREFIALTMKTGEEYEEPAILAIQLDDVAIDQNGSFAADEDDAMDDEPHAHHVLLHLQQLRFGADVLLLPLHPHLDHPDVRHPHHGGRRKAARPAPRQRQRQGKEPEEEKLLHGTPRKSATRTAESHAATAEEQKEVTPPQRQGIKTPFFDTPALPGAVACGRHFEQTVISNEVRNPHPIPCDIAGWRFLTSFEMTDADKATGITYTSNFE